MKITLYPTKMPTTAQQRGVSKRNGKTIFYNRRGTQNAELKAMLRQKAPKQPFAKGTALILDVVFTYAIKNKMLWGQYKQSRPDLDNLMKNLQDYMTDVFFKEKALLEEQNEVCR